MSEEKKMTGILSAPVCANPRCNYLAGTNVYCGACSNWNEEMLKVRNSALEDAARVAEELWRNAPNTRESGFRQNEISHGCIASAEAIRALKSPPVAGEKESGT